MNQGINAKIDKAADLTPPSIWFGVSAVFHYLGPSFAVLLFPYVGILGVIWLRMASASAVLSLLSNPFNTYSSVTLKGKCILIALGISFVVMNTSFYYALDRLPMSLVAAIEFVGILGVALYGLRTIRNFIALMLSVAGVIVLIDIKMGFDSIRFFWAILNTIFLFYI